MYFNIICNNSTTYVAVYVLIYLLKEYIFTLLVCFLLCITAFLFHIRSLDLEPVFLQLAIGWRDYAAMSAGMSQKMPYILQGSVLRPVKDLARSLITTYSFTQKIRIFSNISTNSEIGLTLFWYVCIFLVATLHACTLRGTIISHFNFWLSFSNSRLLQRFCGILPEYNVMLYWLL